LVGRAGDGRGRAQRDGRLALYKAPMVPLLKVENGVGFMNRANKHGVRAALRCRASGDVGGVRDCQPCCLSRWWH